MDRLTSLVRNHRDRARFFRGYRALARRRLRLILLALTLPAIGGGEDPPDPKPDPPDPKPDPPDPAPDPKPDPPDPDKTFTQAELDRIISDRLDRERQKFANYDELKQAADELKQIKDKDRSELDREKERADNAERAAQDATSRANTSLRRAAVINAAASEGVDPEIVYALLADRGFKLTHEEETIEVTVGDDGQVTGAQEAVKAIAAQKNLVGERQQPGPGDGGARTPAPAGDLDEQIAAAEKEGDWKTVNRLNAIKLGQVAESQKA